jgi:putative transposase
VMTLHRWRKLPLDKESNVKPSARSEDELDQEIRIADLQLENSRLRRLVTDLLLEKMRIEETRGGQDPPGDDRRRLAR